jgi:lysine-specific permease
MAKDVETAVSTKPCGNNEWNFPQPDGSGGSGTLRKLEVRHLQMIAIGASIGTGLFLASGATIARAGALGALVAYLIAGICVYFVVHSLGEMATLIPTSGSFNEYASRFVDPALGFTSGWIYW